MDELEPRPVTLLGDAVRPGDPPGGHVARTDVSDLPRRDHLVEGTHRVDLRGLRVVDVYGEKVDRLDPESFEASVHFL